MVLDGPGLNMDAFQWTKYMENPENWWFGGPPPFFLGNQQVLRLLFILNLLNHLDPYCWGKQWNSVQWSAPEPFAFSFPSLCEISEMCKANFLGQRRDGLVEKPSSGSAAHPKSYGYPTTCGTGSIFPTFRRSNQGLFFPHWFIVHHWLVVWNIYYFSIYWEFPSIPTDFHSIIFQRGFRSTTNQIYH